LVAGGSVMTRDIQIAARIEQQALHGIRTEIRGNVERVPIMSARAELCPRRLVAQNGVRERGGVNVTGKWIRRDAKGNPRPGGSKRLDPLPGAIEFLDGMTFAA
jgi:hypothetical protein